MIIQAVSKNPSSSRGMTLAEVVLAIAIIGFAIPLITAGMTSAQHTRQAAEADTRSAWLVRDAQRRMIRLWAETADSKSGETSFTFPSANSEGSSLELFYDRSGTLLSEIAPAIYRVTVDAKPHEHLGNSVLAWITVEIQYPANAPTGKRNAHIYQFLSTREEIR